MAGKKDIPKVRNLPSGGHHVTYRYMNATELAERDARQNAYDAMLARQEAFERNRIVTTSVQKPAQVGCVFAKSCKLRFGIRRRSRNRHWRRNSYVGWPCCVVNAIKFG